ARRFKKDSRQLLHRRHRSYVLTPDGQRNKTKSEECQTKYYQRQTGPNSARNKLGNATNTNEQAKNKQANGDWTLRGRPLSSWGRLRQRRWWRWLKVVSRFAHLKFLLREDGEKASVEVRS